ncbi:MAG: hypothetical protein N2V77_00910 [Canidatus Methanoxibalbensis ujae]|nr:hypothetical protein [Candidatus Methanoxibalbensis ujae]MCW7079317.1 hypothetical protein [Candidatus Methanoxibalbensis ujae]RLG37909.1 MAG: hypothetical protein DRN79_02455 [Methanosarcinales archaeon]
MRFFRFLRKKERVGMSEEERFYLMSCSDLLESVSSVIEGIVVMHEFFWGRASENEYREEMERCKHITKSTLDFAEYIKPPEKFKEMHEHILRGLQYYERSYMVSLNYLNDKRREHIADAIKLALLGSAEIRDGSRIWEKIKRSMTEK